MINTHEKFRLFNKIGKTNQDDLFAEVNWNDDPAIKDCQVVKFTLGDKQAVVDKKYLNSMLFAIGTADEQIKMIPQTIRRSKWYETIISVKAKKDIHKGENITFPLKITLPSVEQEAIAEIKKEQRENKILIPTKQ